MATLKVGMIGAGAISASHIKPVQRYADAEVVAIADKNPDLLADADIDAVMVALPNFLHASVSIDALNAGKHVILEKPFALNKQEAQQAMTVQKIIDGIYESARTGSEVRI